MNWVRRWFNRFRWFCLGCLTVILLGVGGLVAYFVLSEPGRLAEDISASVYQLKTGEDVSSITIDGRIEKAEWERFRWFGTSSSFAVYITNDDEYLYVAIDDRRNTTNDGRSEKVRIAFLPPGETAQVEAGKFKSMEILGSGKVFWQDWKQFVGLSMKYWRGSLYSDEIAERMSKLRNVNQATQLYDEDEIIGGREEEAPYVAIADNITTVPEGLVGKTSFNINRTYEAKVPLSIIDVGSDQSIRVGGYTFIEPPNKWQNYPNTRMGRLTSGWSGQIRFIPTEEEKIPSQEPVTETSSSN